MRPGGIGGGMGGHGRHGAVAGAGRRRPAGAMLNRAAASDQAEELRVADGPGPGPAVGREGRPERHASPSRAASTSPRGATRSCSRSRRVELPAEYYAKAVPVLTPRVYRLAKLTNKSDLVLLPGEATVYVGGDFVGRMRLPLVAAGEPFIAGFGVDPQLQVSRRLIRKARIGAGGQPDLHLRVPDRPAELPARPGQGPALGPPAEAAGRGGGRQPRQDVGRAEHRRRSTSAPPGWTTCCAGTSRCPQGTVGDKTMYLNYEFRLEYARDLPQPRFVSGGLREGPDRRGRHGGGMGGMGGGFRSVGPGDRVYQGSRCLDPRASRGALSGPVGGLARGPLPEKSGTIPASSGIIK